MENAFGSGSAALAPDYDARSSAEAQAYSGRSGTLVDLAFVLSPNTRVIFSADAVASALPQNGFTFADAVEAAGTLSIRSAAWAESFAAPIPEPRTGAMLLAGITALLARGSAGRGARRKRPQWP